MSDSPSLRRLRSLPSHQGGRANPAQENNADITKGGRLCEAASQKSQFVFALH